MRENQTKDIFIICLLIIIIGLTWYIYANSKSKGHFLEENSLPVASSTVSKNTANEPKEMDLIVYLQDEEAAITSDCGVTYPRIVHVPHTRALADASLQYLFNNELSEYGEYVSVRLENSVAKITLSRANHPDSSRWSSLSSCQAQHLISVISDTLLQYDTIDAIELYSPTGKIQF